MQRPQQQMAQASQEGSDMEQGKYVHASMRAVRIGAALDPDGHGPCHTHGQLPSIVWGSGTVMISKVALVSGVHHSLTL